MKKIITLLLLAVVTLSAFGCYKKSEQSIVGTWEYNGSENGMGAVYDLKDDGTGTYTMKVGETEVTYELKYEIQNNHLLVRYVNNEIFSEDDVFDSEFSFKDSNTFVIKDETFGDMEFVRK